VLALPILRDLDDQCAAAGGPAKPWLASRTHSPREVVRRILILSDILWGELLRGMFGRQSRGSAPQQ
jgi:hypothetical protein